MGSVAGHYPEEENEGYSEMLYTTQIGSVFCGVVTDIEWATLKQGDHHWTPSQGREKGVRHTQAGWDSDLTRIMLPHVSNDRPGQSVMQTNSCETN